MKSILIGALGLASFAGAAYASEPVAADQTMVRVGYDASSVSTPRAAENLLGRLSSAAMEACGAFPGSFRDYKMTVIHSACYQQKLDQAVAQVDSPLLSQVYQHEGPLIPASLG